MLVADAAVIITIIINQPITTTSLYIAHYCQQRDSIFYTATWRGGEEEEKAACITDYTRHASSSCVNKATKTF